MSGIYQQSPRADAAFRLGELDPPRRFVAAADGSWPAGIPGTPGEPYYDRPAGYFNGTVDWETITEPKFGYDAAQGNNTDGLIDPVTNAVKTQLPPNSRSFILGPLVDGFVPNHISDAFTRIGYIEKDTRQFVLLASFTGEWISGLNGYTGVPTWNGTSTGFTQVNPNFTLDMALWFRNEMLKGRYVKNVSYNAVGGIPQQQSSNPDAPQPLGGNGVGGGSGEAGQNPDGTGTGTGSGGEPNAGTPQGDPDPGKDPGENDLWGMSGRRKRKNRRGSGARGNRGRKKPDPTPSPTPDPQGGRGGGTGNPTNRRGSGARGNRNRPDPTPSPKPPKPDRPYTPKPQGGRGGGQGNPTNPRGSGQTPRPTPSPSPKPDRPYTPRPQGGRGGGQGNPTNPRGTGARPTPSPTPTPTPKPTPRPRPTPKPTPKSNTQKAYERNRYNNRPEVKAGITVKNAITKLGNFATDPLQAVADYLGNNLTPPAAEYSTNIAKSVLFNKPITVKQEDIPKGDIDKFFKNFGYQQPLPISNGKPTPYADDNFYVDEKGNVKSNIGPNGEKGYYKRNNTADMGGGKDIAGYGNPLAAAGQAQTQYVIPDDGSEPYFLYTDHAYQNLTSDDPGEVPDIIKTAISGALHALTGKSDPTKPNTGPMSGYPPNVKGDVKTEFRIPYSKLPENIKNRVDFEMKYQEMVRSGKAKPINYTTESYNLSKKRILREIRQPLKEIKELPKTTKLKGYKPNFKGKYSPQNTPDVTASKKSDRLVMAKNAEGQMWSVGDKYFKGWETTNRMNHVYSRVGESDKFFEQITANNSTDVERKMQEHLNHVYHNKAMLKIDSNYQSPFGDNIEEQETYDNKINDPLFTKVAKRLKKEIDYEKKPAKVGYPNEAPPKIDPNTGMHPKFGKRYKYDKLDPISAKTMAGAPTGDPEIDANVKKAAKVKEDWRSDLKNLWLGSEREDWKKKLEEGMTTQMLTGILPSTGNADLEVLQTGLTGDGLIDYGEGGLGDEVMVSADSQYTCFTNLDAINNANDPNNVGYALRLFDQNTKQFRSGSTGGGAHGYVPAIPGYVQGMMRNAKPSGDYNRYENDRRERKSLPVVQGGSNLYYHLYGPTNDVLGLGYGTWNSIDGVTATNTGTRLDFDGSGSPRYAALKAIDSTGFDTIKIHALLGDNDIVSTYTDNTGVVRDARVQVYYWAGDHKDYVSHPSASSSLISGQPRDGWRPINMKPNGELDPDVDPYIIKFHGERIGTAIGDDGIPYSTSNKNAPYSIPIPDYTRSKNAKYMLVQVDISGGSSNNAFSLLSVRFQRRSNVKTPALTKPLTDIETSPFVRVGPTKKNEGGKERKKKVQDIIRSGLKYTGKKFSKDFPVRTDLE